MSVDDNNNNNNGYNGDGSNKSKSNSNKSTNSSHTSNDDDKTKLVDNYLERSKYNEIKAAVTAAVARATRNVGKTKSHYLNVFFFSSIISFPSSEIKGNENSTREHSRKTQ